MYFWNVQEPTQLPDTPVTSIKPPYKLDRWTGGDSGVPWGSDDCWLEPWTLASAQATLEKLIAHWHREPIRAQKEEEGPNFPKNPLTLRLWILIQRMPFVNVTPLAIL